MGATTFIHRVEGKSVKTAFNKARKAALKAHGDSGYTGTIAEKDTVIEVKMPEGTENPIRYADTLLDDPRFDDKWGPAGGFKVGDGTVVLFGWASE